MEVVIDERHGLPSASGMERLIACRGSWQAEQGCPEEECSSVTSDGTLIASALETGETDDLPEEQRGIAERLQEMRQEAGQRWMADFDIREVTEIREQRFWILADNDWKEIASARVDYALMADTHALIIDEKTGFLPVTPSDLNMQLRTQAVALFSEYPSLRHIRVAIAQKRLTERFDATDYTLDDLHHSVRQIRQASWEAHQPEAEAHRNPGEWCRHCRAKNDCRAAVAYASVPIIHMGQAVTEEGKPGEAALATRLHGLPPATLALIHLRRPLADKIFDAVSRRLKTLDDATLSQIGLKRVPGKVRRVVEENHTAQGLLTDLIPDFLRFCNFSVNKAAKWLAQDKGVSEKEAERQLHERLQPVTDKVPNQSSIVSV